MPKINEILEWDEFGSSYKMYSRHHLDENEKVCIQLIFEDVNHDKVTEINIPSDKVKGFLTMVNGDLLSRRYEINV